MKCEMKLLIHSPILTFAPLIFGNGQLIIWLYIGRLITYPCWISIYALLIKEAPVCRENSITPGLKTIATIEDGFFLHG